jgi:CRP/FNR family transcriptional regulator, cyclic AMP receptor protein
MEATRMAVDTKEALRAVPLFADLSDKDLERVVAISKQVQHAAGKVVVEEDESAVGFHLVLEGSAEASTGGTIVSTLGPGAYFGEISLLDGKPRSASVTAISDLTTFAIPAWNFNRLLDEHPEMMRALLIALCARIRNLRDR